MKILLVFAFIGLALCEKPAPYVPKGWKPQGQRLELPSRQYGIPQDPNRVEITTVSNEYGPPTRSNNDDDFLQVQGLPAASAFSQFRQQQNQQTSRFVTNGRPLLLSPSFAPQFGEQLRQNPKNDVQRFNVNFGGNSFSAPQQLPQREYGAPFTTTTELPEFQTEYPQNFPPQQIPNREEREEDQGPVIAIANAEAHGRSDNNVNIVAASQQGQSGQYYILLPDSSLQKVRYATGQSEDDRTSNGFTAQLK